MNSKLNNLPLEIRQNIFDYVPRYISVYVLSSIKLYIGKFNIYTSIGIIEYNYKKIMHPYCPKYYNFYYDNKMLNNKTLIKDILTCDLDFIILNLSYKNKIVQNYNLLSRVYNVNNYSSSRNHSEYLYNNNCHNRTYTGGY